jgi:hypothetical protein
MQHRSRPGSNLIAVRSGQAPAADYATMNIAITALAINAE